MTSYSFDWDFIEAERQRATGVLPLRESRIARGDGAWLWDDAGNRILDCAIGHGVAFLGHAHPKVVAAISEQAATLMTLTASYPHPLRAEFLNRLAAAAPEGLDRIFLASTGTESIEAALKFSRLSTGRTGFVAAKRAFHGRTMGALSTTFNPKYRKPFGPLIDGVSHVAYGSIEALEAAVDENTAAVLLEPIQGEGGVFPAPDGYLQAAASICARNGALLILDEVQSGVGRTGSWFAAQHFGVVPDILCTSKALGGGAPIAAVLVGPRVTGFYPGAHGSTFSGNLLSVAAANAVLKTIEEEGLLDRARHLGEVLQSSVRALPPEAQEHIVTVRGIGLLQGVALKMKSAPIVRAMLNEENILVLGAGPKVVRFLPPVVIEEEDLRGAVKALGRVLARHGRSS